MQGPLAAGPPLPIATGQHFPLAIAVDSPKQVIAPFPMIQNRQILLIEFACAGVSKIGLDVLGDTGHECDS